MSNSGSGAAQESPDEFALTPLTQALEIHARAQAAATTELSIHMGVRTPRLFDDPAHEIDSLFSSAGLFDLGWRGKILVKGNDRLRWLNGMVTNTVQGLAQNEGNYNFLLSTQGRILGDCYLYRRTGDLILDSNVEHIPALLSHLDHYIIMDEVELEDVSSQWTALAIAGPRAPALLSALGAALPAGTPAAGNARFCGASIHGVEVTLVEAFHVLVPRYEIWLPPADVLPVWEALKTAGAKCIGLQACETLRVVEGTPLYGIDLSDRDLPQEANQARALNFQKGCYLGQEIVERIRSRGKVHRQLRQFSLDGAYPDAPFELHSEGQAAGRVTSTASISVADFSGDFALGFIREESVARQTPIEYDGGIATPLNAPPQMRI